MFLLKALPNPGQVYVDEVTENTIRILWGEFLGDFTDYVILAYDPSNTLRFNQNVPKGTTDIVIGPGLVPATEYAITVQPVGAGLTSSTFNQHTSEYSTVHPFSFTESC